MVRLRFRLFVVSGMVLSLMSLVLPAAPAQAASNDNNVEWGLVYHDSRDPLYRSPGGAVSTGTAVRLRLRTATDDLTAVQVRIWNDRIDTSSTYNMSLVAQDVQFAGDANLYDFWEYTLPASADPTVYWYRFIVTDGSDTDYYEDDAARTGGAGQMFDTSPDNSWQLTHYKAGFQTPDWVKNAIFYQVFPDRFRDGDPSNNPAAGEFFYGNYDTIYRSNGTDWHTHICDPRAAPGSSSVCPDKYSQNFYGGDLQGLNSELSYIDSLGVTALYLNPIFESPSNHKYDTTDFFHIDDNFGTLADFQALTANAQGLEIVLDGVFNHSSSDSIYFDRYDRWNATTSDPAQPFPTPVAPGTSAVSGACETNDPLITDYVNWYTFFTFGGTGSAPCSDNRDYPKWYNQFDSLPVLQHDYSNVRSYFLTNGTNAVAPYWISQGADGWRLDVAPEIDHGQINDPGDDYMETLRDVVRAQDPNAYIVGEEWGNATSWTIGANNASNGEWDATMNYQFGSAVMSFWRTTYFEDNDFNPGSSAGPLDPLDGSGVNERLLNLQERYPSEALYAMMNLFNSHDTNRVLVLLNQGPQGIADFNNPAYDWSGAIDRLYGATIMQMTLPGAPTIYYGDEVGTVNPISVDENGLQDDPYNRVPYPWLDETGTPYYTHMQTDGPGTVRNEIFTHYQTLTGIRNSIPALRTGSFDPLYTDANVYVYGRKDATGAAIVVVNKSTSIQTATIDTAGYLPAGTTYTDQLGSGTVSSNASGELNVTIPAQFGLILTPAGLGTVPSCVTDLTATNNVSNIDLSWSATSGAANYQIWRSRLSGGGYDLLTTQAGTTYTDTTVSASPTYYYLIVPEGSDLLTPDLFCNNEVSETTSYDLGNGATSWFNLQFPVTLNETVSLTGSTPLIYGQLWIDGVTSSAGATPGIMAQIGWGADGTLPTDASWQWFDAPFNVDVVNNDEFTGTFAPDEIGSFDYLYRYSGDGGNTWYYGTVAGPVRDLSGYNAADAGQITINACNTDTTAPDAPANLRLTNVNDSTVELAWDASASGDVVAYDIYRKLSADALYPADALARVDGLTLAYDDTSVTTGESYDYKVVALDDCANMSIDSNELTVVAETRMVDVTLSVTVPDPSPGTIHVAGSFDSFAGSPYPGWDPAGIALTDTGGGVHEVTLTLPDLSSFEYKYTRGAWETVEKEADGVTEVPNRNLSVAYGASGTQSVNDTVVNWRDPIVVSLTPADGVAGVADSATITVEWNQAMPADPSGFLTITGPGSGGGAVAGTFSYDNVTFTHTFTPDSPLADGEYTVTTSGAVDDAGGDSQMVDSMTTFTVFASAAYDFNSDGLISPSDVIYVINRVNSGDMTADVDGDSDVDADDVNFMYTILGN